MNEGAVYIGVIISGGIMALSITGSAICDRLEDLRDAQFGAACLTVCPTDEVVEQEQDGRTIRSCACKRAEPAR